MPLAWIIPEQRQVECHSRRHLISIGAHRFPEAVTRCLKGLEIDPTHPLLRLWLGCAYEQLSRYDEAVPELRTAGELLAGLPIAVGSLAHAEAAAGNLSEAQRLIEQLVETAGRLPADEYSVAVIYAVLGRKEEALESLAKACDCRSSWLTLHVKGDPRLDTLRSDPRFESILKRMMLA